MITIDQYRDVAKCRVFRDDSDLMTWYIMPFAPRIALDDQGKPIVSLVWYRRDVSNLTDEERKTRLGGGILTLSAELSATDAQMREIRKTLAADPLFQAKLGARWRDDFQQDENKLAESFKIGTVPIKDGVVTIAVLAETPAGGQPGEFVSQLVGIGRVSMLGNQRAAFMAKLTQDGAVLVWKMFEKNLAAIRVAYDLTYDHRLNAVRMIVRCEARKAYEAVRELWQNLSDDAHFRTTHSGGTTTLSYGRDQSQNAGDILRATAEASQASSVTIIPEGDAAVVTPEQTEELIKAGNEMISEFLASTILEFKPADPQYREQPDLATELPEYDGKKYGHHGIKFYDLKNWNQEMDVSLNYNFTSKAVIEGHLAPNDNLSNVLQGFEVEAFRTQVELNAAFYQYLDVQLVCTANFDEDPIDLVECHLSYAADSPQGPLRAVKDYVFRKDTPPQRFSTYLAGPDKRTYDYSYTVYYKGSDRTLAVNGKSDGTVLVLDTDRMGVLRVEVEAGLIDWTRFKAAIIKLWYLGGSTRKEMEYTITSQQPKQVWTEVIAAEVTEPYHYSVTLIDSENRRIECGEERSTAKRLLINQPISEDLEVAVVPAGEFGGEGLISRVVVAMRYRDPANDYVTEDIITLADNKTVVTWKTPLIDKKRRTYEYQTTVFYSDGITREDVWRTSDKTVLPVGDPYGFRVLINPRLLAKSGFAFGQIHLNFDDSGAGIHAEKTLPIDDFLKPLTWRFRLGAPDRHTFKYRVTLYKDDGTERMMDPVDCSEDVLVLKPPPVS